MEIKDYQRKTFPVQAVRLTDDNLEEVAEWCHGEIMATDEPITYFIKVDVRLPLNERQTKAFVGDYVVLHNGGFKVFQERGFHKSFEEVENQDLEHDEPLFRDAGSGQFVTEEYAEEHPSTTVKETNLVREIFEDPHANEPDEQMTMMTPPTDADPS